MCVILEKLIKKSMGQGIQKKVMIDIAYEMNRFTNLRSVVRVDRF